MQFLQTDSFHKIARDACLNDDVDDVVYNWMDNYICMKYQYIENNVCTRVTNCFSAHERVILVFII